MFKLTPDSPTLTMPGVFVEVFNQGVWIIGESGSGKSQLALELVSRGHFLIADDAVVFTSCDSGVVGSCPPLLQDFLTVPNLGVLNIRALYGNKSIQDRQLLTLIIELMDPSFEKIYLNKALEPLEQTKSLLNMNFPHFQFFLTKTGNHALLIELLIRNFILKKTGYNSVSSFIEKQSVFLERDQMT